MKSTGLDGAHAEVAQTSTHFGRSPGRERHCQQTVGIINASVHTVGDTVSNGPGLACSCTSQDTQRTVQGGCNGPLFLVQPGQYAFLGRAFIHHW